MRRAASIAAGLTVALAVSACSDPYNDRAAAPAERRAPVASAAPQGELPGRIPAYEQRALGRPQARPAASQREAVTRYAQLVTNWTAATVGTQYREAARAAVGQARRDAEQTAASAGNDAQLTQAATTSHGEVVAVVAQPDGWTLVVTREELKPDAGPARFRVYRAHTRRVAGGVAVDAWEAQP